MSEPDQIDMMSEADVRTALRDVVAQNVDLQHSLATAERELKASKEPVCSVCAGDKEHAAKINCICGGIGTEWAELEGLRRELAELRREVEKGNKYRVICEDYIGLARVALHLENNPVKAFERLETLCKKLDVLDGDAQNPTTPHEVNHEPERG